MNTVDVELIPAPVEAVAAVLNDVARWPEWMGISDATVEGGESDGPLGIGAQYALRAGPLKNRFEVVESDPPQRSRYRLVSGWLPVRDYQGEIIMRPSGEDTLLRWCVTFRPRMPGTGAVLQRLIGASHRAAVRGLAARVGGRPSKDHP